MPRERNNYEIVKLIEGTTEERNAVWSIEESDTGCADSIDLIRISGSATLGYTMVTSPDKLRSLDRKEEEKEMGGWTSGKSVLFNYESNRYPGVTNRYLGEIIEFLYDPETGAYASVLRLAKYRDEVLGTASSLEAFVEAEHGAKIVGVPLRELQKCSRSESAWLRSHDYQGE